jgi:predicted phosphohydrolase
VFRSLAWATDVHLDHLPAVEGLLAFADELGRENPDAVLITGDISVSARLEVDLELLVDRLGCPLFFLLGNHDFYGSGIERVRERVRRLCAEETLLRWLPEHGLVRLNDRAALIGVDGWGDARCGNWEHSPVRLSDFVLIEDLVHRNREDLVARLRALGDVEAHRARALLNQALPKYQQIIFATHVPPFEEACWNEGETPGPSDNWSPWFVCMAVGDVLREMAQRWPDRHITVLCGHTHGGGTVQILDNLEVITGEAHYGRPQVQRIFRPE